MNGETASFTNGILDGVVYVDAAWQGEQITPEIVVLHDTASRLGTGAAARYLAKNDRKVSAHFVLERDGSLTQLVPVTTQANHAGRSEYHGRKWCNRFSIGIEIVNPGIMTRFSEHEAQAWYGTRFDIAAYGIQEITTREHGRGLWMPYTEEQIDTLIDLLHALFKSQESLRDIVTHWYVSPGRKVDTNPLFPLDHVRSLIFGREDPRDIEADDGSYEQRDERFVQIETHGDTLNMRQWPNFNPNIIARIPDETVVPVVRAGTFKGRDWLLVRYGGQEGWIVSEYAAPFVRQDSTRTGFHK